MIWFAVLLLLISFCTWSYGCFSWNWIVLICGLVALIASIGFVLGVLIS